MKNQSSIRAFEGVLEMMSELFFASLEPGNNYTTKPLILNTALYYALGYCSGRYVNVSSKKGSSKQNPTYVEDTASFYENLYVSPARPINSIRFASEISNARSDEYIQFNTYEKQMNSPTGKYGVRKQILPGGKFSFFLLSFDGSEPDMPAYIRLGKKRSKAAITWSEHPVRVKKGSFILNHPVLIDDLTQIPSRDISFKRMQPFDVIERGGFDGDYIQIQKGDKEDVLLPASIRFLQRIRV
jgi:CRISPR-associated protein Csc1